jgi:hypothetical protein
MSRFTIVPWAQCQAHEYDNLIALCPNCHTLAEAGKIDRKSLRIYKANLRFAHDKFSYLEVDLLTELNKLPPKQGLMWPQFNFMLIKRIVDAGYVTITPKNVSVHIGGMPSAPDILQITDKGRAFVESWNTDN